MIDPVVAMDGHSYEFAVIEEWFREHQSSPVTNQQLTSKLLVRNVALRNAMQEWDELVGSEAGAPPRDNEAVSPTYRSSSSGGHQVAPIAFEAPEEWASLARRRRQTQHGDGYSPTVCRRGFMPCLFLCFLLPACGIMWLNSPWNEAGFPGEGHSDPGPHSPSSSPPSPPSPPHRQCEHGEVPALRCPCHPLPDIGHWEQPGPNSLAKQLMKWETWEPTRIDDVFKRRPFGDAKFGDVTFWSPLPALNNHSSPGGGSGPNETFYPRVNWIETGSKLQACTTEKRASCISYSLRVSLLPEPLPDGDSGDDGIPLFAGTPTLQ